MTTDSTDGADRQSRDSGTVAVSREGRQWLRNLGMASAPQFLALVVLLYLLGNGVILWRMDTTVQKQIDYQGRMSADQREDNRRMLDEVSRERASREASTSSRELRVLDLGNRTLEALRDNAQVMKAVQAGLDRQADDSKRIREAIVEHNEEAKKLRSAVEKLVKCFEGVWCDAHIAPLPSAKGWKN